MIEGTAPMIMDSQRAGGGSADFLILVHVRVNILLRLYILCRRRRF